MNPEQAKHIEQGQGFIAALDQSGGSTPKALRDYGIDEGSFATQDEMFDLIHAMRTRVITAEAFSGSKVLGAILFEQTMQRSIEGLPTATYLWERKSIVPFLKIDKGLADEAAGVQLMKPIDDLAAILDAAVGHEIFGTKMRSVIKLADAAGIDAILDQQFSFASQILDADLMPIVEPEVDISSPEKQAAEGLLLDGILNRLGELRGDQRVMLKLSLPTETGLYEDLSAHPNVARVVALSGGYSRDEACRLLKQNRGLIASFSRALLGGLRAEQTDEDFNKQLASSIDMIYDASVMKSQS